MRKTKLDGAGVAMLLGVQALLAVNQIIIKLVNEGLQPVFFAGLRSLLAIGFVWAWLIYKRRPPRLRREAWGTGLLIGSLFAAEFLFLFLAIDLTSWLDFAPNSANVLTMRLDNRDNPRVPPGKPQDQLDFTYFGGLYRIDLLTNAETRLTPLTEANTEPAVLRSGNVDSIFFRGGPGNIGGIDRITYDGTTVGMRTPHVTTAQMTAFMEITNDTTITNFSMTSDSEGNLYFNNTDTAAIGAPVTGSTPS